jgi:hypothetical protein
VSPFDSLLQFYNFKPLAPAPQKSGFFWNQSVSPTSHLPPAFHSLTLLFSPLTISVTPQLLNDLSRLLEIFQNHSISTDLKQYRPQRRPIISCPPGARQNQPISDQLARKRKLMIRDWFFYVVWYVRLKRLLNNYYADSNTMRDREEDGRDREEIKTEIIERIN